MGKTYQGIDVSEHQGSIDWSRASKAVDFVIPRTGYGYCTKDAIFDSTVAGAKQYGVDIPGIYHFSYATSEADAMIEAEFAIKCAQEAGLPRNTIIFYDFEYDSNRYFNSIENKKPAKERRKLTPLLIQEFTKAFCDTVSEHGYKPGVYFNQDYYKNWYNNGKAFDSSWMRWLADYEGEPNYPCDFQQTSSSGSVAGVRGNVDTNLAFYDYKSNTTSTSANTKKPDSVIAKEVIEGKWGNGDERKKKLTEAGYDYDSVQALVNSILPKESPKKKVNETIVNDVIAGKYGNGDERKKKLEAEGYVYKEVQDAVNKKLSGVNTQTEVTGKVSPAQSFDDSLTGKYKVSAASLNMRYVPGLYTESNVVRVLRQNEVVQCWGYFTQKPEAKWLLIQIGSLTGFVDAKYLIRI